MIKKLIGLFVMWAFMVCGSGLANAETVNVLKQVRKAENIVTDTLEKSGLTAPQRKTLDDLSDTLREIDNALLLNDLRKLSREAAKETDRILGL